MQNAYRPNKAGSIGHTCPRSARKYGISRVMGGSSRFRDGRLRKGHRARSRATWASLDAGQASRRGRCPTSLARYDARSPGYRAGLARVAVHGDRALAGGIARQQPVGLVAGERERLRGRARAQPQRSLHEQRVAILDAARWNPACAPSRASAAQTAAACGERPRCRRGSVRRGSPRSATRWSATQRAGHHGALRERSSSGRQ